MLDVVHVITGSALKFAWGQRLSLLWRRWALQRMLHIVRFVCSHSRLSRLVLRNFDNNDVVILHVVHVALTRQMILAMVVQFAASCSEVPLCMGLQFVKRLRHWDRDTLHSIAHEHVRT